MNEKALNFTRKAALTTFLSFTLITFFYLGMIVLVSGDETGGNFPMGYCFRYTIGKLFCIFLFSLCLGFLNRLPERAGKRALNRLLHLLLSFGAYFIFMILMFFSMYESDSLTSQGILVNVILFVLGYPLTLGVAALGRAIFLPKEKKMHKSILD